MDRNPIDWVNTELGKPSREWSLKHWAAFVAIVAAGAALLIGFS